MVVNPERSKIVIAWTNLNVGCADKLTKLRGESGNEVWACLWSSTEYSGTELKEKMGVTLSKSGLEGKMKPLIRNRVLYPHGMVNSFV